MYRFLVKPKWLLAHLLFVFMIIVMINLGFWQLRRLDERREFNSTVSGRAAVAAVPIDELMPGTTDDPGETFDKDSAEFRSVVLTGEYLTDHQYERDVIRDDVHGFDVLNILQLADGSVVVVDRGWMPASAPPPPAPAGEVTLTVRLRESASGGTGQTSPAGTQPAVIFRVDVRAIGNELDLPARPMYVDVIESTPADAQMLQLVPFPELGEGAHFGYAVQWFLFSVVAFAGWVLAIARKIGELRDPAPGDEPVG